MVRGIDSHMLMDSSSPEQQMIRSTIIYDMKMSSCSNKPYSQVEVDVAKGEGALPPKLDASFG